MTGALGAVTVARVGLTDAVGTPVISTQAAGTPVFLAHAVGTAEFYWAFVAEGAILLATLLLVLAPRWARGRPPPPRFRLVAFGAALLASLITLIGKLLEVWPGHPLFPSGHTAYVLTIALFLVVLSRRWWPVALALVGVTAVALVVANYHPIEDIAGGAVVAAVVFAVIRRQLVPTA